MTAKRTEAAERDDKVREHAQVGLEPPVRRPRHTVARHAPRRNGSSPYGRVPPSARPEGKARGKYFFIGFFNRVNIAVLVGYQATSARSMARGRRAG